MSAGPPRKLRVAAMAKRLLTNSIDVQRSHGNEGVARRDGVVNMSRGKTQNLMFQWLLAAFLLQSVGCSGGGVPATEEAARGALTAALDAWKAGRKVDEMRQQTPEVVVGDTDWKLGRQLVGYEIGTGKLDG